MPQAPHHTPPLLRRWMISLPNSLKVSAKTRLGPTGLIRRRNQPSCQSLSLSRTPLPAWRPFMDSLLHKSVKASSKKRIQTSSPYSNQSFRTKDSTSATLLTQFKLRCNMHSCPRQSVQGPQLLELGPLIPRVPLLPRRRKSPQRLRTTTTTSHRETATAARLAGEGVATKNDRPRLPRRQ